jgi:hypothetical protein
MPLFPSTEWMDAFADELREQDGAHEAAEVLDGVYRFVVEPAGPLKERQVHDIEIRPGADGVPATRRLEGTDHEPRLTLTASYERWRQLISGQLDVKMAVLLRRLRVQGDLQRLIREMGSAAPLTDALSAVDTQWR